MERIKLLGLKIRNLYRVEAADLTFDPESGRLTEITGPNMAGKTSVLRSFLATVYGAGAVSEHALNDMVEEGEEGFVRAEFSNGWKITRTVSAKHPKGVLRIEKDTGVKGKQADLDDWVWNKGADILAPRQWKLPQLTEELLSVGKDPELPGKLAGTRKRRETLEAERSPHISEKQRAERTKKPEGDRPEAVDVSAAMEKLGGLQAQATVRTDKDLAVRRVSEERERIAAKVTEKVEEVSELHRKLDEAEAGLKGWNTTFSAVRETERKLEDEWADLPNPTDEIEAVEARLQEADSMNLALEPWKDWDKALLALAREGDEIRRLNDLIAETRLEETALLDRAQIPITGLSFGEDGEPLLYGRSMELASGREWMLFSVELAEAKDSDLGVLVLDEANDIDVAGMELLLDYLEERDFQALVCRILPSGVGEVVACENGKAWNVGGPDGEPSWEKGSPHD